MSIGTTTRNDQACWDRVGDEPHFRWSSVSDKQQTFQAPSLGEVWGPENPPAMASWVGDSSTQGEASLSTVLSLTHQEHRLLWTNNRFTSAVFHLSHLTAHTVITKILWHTQNFIFCQSNKK